MYCRQENQICEQFFDPNGIRTCDRERERERERCEIKSYKFFRPRWDFNLRPLTEGERAKRITIEDGNSIARPQSSQLDLSDTMHGYMRVNGHYERERQAQERRKKERD
jgi:hypothetical protein